MKETRHDASKPAPFDTVRLDALLEDEGIDVLVVEGGELGNVGWEWISEDGFCKENSIS